jgi:hypothetical protein
VVEVEVVEAAVVEAAVEAEAAVARDGEVLQAPAAEMWGQLGWPFQSLVRLGGVAPADWAAAKKWMLEVVARPDPRLLRAGAVCPCVTGALCEDRVLLSRVPLPDAPDIDKRAFVIERLKALGGIFLASTSSDEASLDCMLVTVPGLARHELRYVINGAYEAIRRPFYESKMLIGGFHEFNMRRSRLNKDFFPMRTATPMFAMRHMQQLDGRNLRNEPEYYDVYRKFYGEFSE